MTLLSSVARAGSPDRPGGCPFSSRSVVHALHGMVASSHPLASQIGLDVLRQGGSAVDAAIAANAALGFLEPVSCGIGGDLFAMVWDAAGGRLHGLNGSGRAPAALTAAGISPGPDGTIPLFSPVAWTVPGAVDAWFELHVRFGRLPMATVLAPAAAAAREGAPVPQVIAAAWRDGAAQLRDVPGFRETFLPDGRPPEEGEIFRNEALARAYDLVARDGRDAFYRGPIGAALVRFSEEVGGVLSASDLAEHRSQWVAPISTAYRGVDVWELPPNGQGLAALQMLNMLETFDLAAMGRDAPDFWHVLVEVKKLAFADRARLYADPDFVECPVERLLSKEYARERARRVDLARAARTDEPGLPREHGDTTYLATADVHGNMVSLIQSNYTGFGSGYAVPAWGFGIQNRGAQFSLDPRSANFLQPRKRPFHTIIPAFLTVAGEPRVAFGVMGGDMQPQGHAQIVVNLVDLGMNLQQAGDAGRCHHTRSSEPTGTRMRSGGVVSLESTVPAAVRIELVRRGHTVEEAIAPRFGGYQAVARDPATGVLSGATEWRKDGCAAGY